MVHSHLGLVTRVGLSPDVYLLTPTPQSQLLPPLRSLPPSGFFPLSSRTHHVPEGPEQHPTPLRDFLLLWGRVARPEAQREKAHHCPGVCDQLASETFLVLPKIAV